MEDRSPHLLVIEDAHDQAILVGVAARHALPGLEVHIAEDGQKGIEYLSGIAPLSDPPQNPTPDLVILDYQMPVVDGLGVLQWMRDHVSGLTLPVVMLTGSKDPALESRARALGAADVFEKPKELDGLGLTVRSIVTRWISPGDIMAAHMRLSG